MQVYHMSGAGNDFAVIDARNVNIDLQETAKTLCAKLGADGFLALDNSSFAHFRLHFYNPDGLRGEMCGNGARCICRFAYDLGLAPEEMTLETDAGLVYGWRLDENTYRVKLNDAGVLDLNRTEDAAYVELGNPGIPHSVTELPCLDFAHLDTLRPLSLSIRHDPAFPKGVNVNLFTRLSEDCIRILTFERGVEDYTLACGTGCGSVAVTLKEKGLLPGGRLTCENRGGILTIEINDSGLFLEGQAEILNTFHI